MSLVAEFGSGSTISAPVERIDPRRNGAAFVEIEANVRSRRRLQRDGWALDGRIVPLHARSCTLGGLSRGGGWEWGKDPPPAQSRRFARVTGGGDCASTLHGGGWRGASSRRIAGFGRLTLPTAHSSQPPSRLSNTIKITVLNKNKYDICLFIIYVIYCSGLGLAFQRGRHPVGATSQRLRAPPGCSRPGLRTRPGRDRPSC